MTYHGSTYGMKTPYTDAMMVECFFLADFSGNTCVKPGDIFCDILTPQDIQTSKTWCHRCAMAGWENHSMGDSPAKYV